MTPLDIALSYIRRGWNPVPNAFRAKKPIGNEWQNRIINETNAAQYFNGGPQNIGVQLGKNSNGLTDVDLDCIEAIAIASYVLPPTKAIFGRRSARASHWLYTTDLADTVDSAELNYNEPLSKDGHLLELRIGGCGKGAQTVVPGSVHETGEEIAWEAYCDGEPAVVAGDDLRRMAERLAALALVARKWPGKGARHNAALTLGGFLARAELTAADVGVAVEAVARAAGDPEWKDRKHAAKDAAEDYAKTGKGRGLKSLGELIGDVAAGRVAEWLSYFESEDEGEAGQQGGSQSSQAQSGAGAGVSSSWPQPIDLWAKFDPPKLPHGLLPRACD